MKKATTGYVIAGIIFFIIGALFAGIGTIISINDAKFKENALTTDGIITDIRSYTDSDGDTSYDVYVEFYVDGTRYDGELGYYISSMDIGEEILIYYDPKNPNEFTGEDSIDGIIIFIIIGGIFALIGLGFIIYEIVNRAKKKRILGYNFIIQANITNFSINRSVKVNGKSPYIMIANTISPYDGKTYVFKSDSIWNDLSNVLQTYNIKTVPVYVNPNNYKEYYIDIDFFKQYLGN